MVALVNKKIDALFKNADIQVDGGRPGDPRVLNKKVYRMIARHGSLGLGESYMMGYWECDQLDHFFFKILRHRLSAKVRYTFASRCAMQMYRMLNPQRKSRSFEVGEKHYNLGNQLYELMLGPSMVYTCAYWHDVNTLDAAQYAKLDLVCRKLQLKPGMRVLDIGCGFGSFAKYAAENYGVSVVGVTISEEQQRFGMEFCKGLDVDLRLQDYRDLEGQYDAVVSIGMFEHVGDKNYQVYMDTVARVLSDEGLFLLHTIAQNEHSPYGDAWITKYIFPNGHLPSIRSAAMSIESNFVLEDWQNLGPNYDPTLMAWYQNFNDGWSSIKDLFDDEFYRMWRYYLLSCAGAFRARGMQVWQVLLSKSGLSGGVPLIR